jgi:hypothetical protein
VNQNFVEGVITFNSLVCRQLGNPKSLPNINLNSHNSIFYLNNQRMKL